MIVSNNHPTIIWHLRQYITLTPDTGHRKRVQASSYGVPGYKPRNIWTPSSNKSAHTHCWVQTSSILIRGLALKFLTLVYTPKPTIIDVVFYPRFKFPTLILEHHNDSLMLLYVNMLCFFFFFFSLLFVLSLS